MPRAKPAEVTDGRVARRIAAMRRVQAAALGLFEQRGFAAVAVEDIAAQAGVGAASIYRNFGTKERIVLWDEYDPALLALLAARLQSQPPLAALRDAVLDRLAVVYSRDRQRILRRTRLMLSEPALLAANAAQQELFRAELVGLFQTRRSGLEAEVLAGVSVGVLDACVREWARREGRVAMSRLMKSAFQLVRAFA